jgi:mannobiose 2-epimerase
MREGKPVDADPNSVHLKSAPVGGFFIGYQSMNTHIHMLEAVSQLYEVWKDDVVRQRLEELLSVIRDKVCRPAGSYESFLQQ